MGGYGVVRDSRQGMNSSTSNSRSIVWETNWHLCVRWFGLAALLIAEILLLTIRFDTMHLDGVDAAWARILGASPALLRVGIAMVGVTLLLGGASLWKEVWRDGNPVPPAYPWVVFAAGHLVALAVFTWLKHPYLVGNRPCHAPCPGTTIPLA